MVLKERNFLIAGIILAAVQTVGMAQPDVLETMLDNGMKILSVERPGTSVVSFAVFYRTGSIDESPGKRGLAHYMEHMMFKTTRNLENEAFARLVGAVGGGHSNANTSNDRTMYHATVPPNRLELIIRLEAERMQNLQPAVEEAMKELDVVKEELRLNYMDNPNGRFRFEFNCHAFEAHPYRILTIGTLEDLETVTYDDLMEFYRKYYSPNRAVAVVVGDFKTSEMLDLMKTFFGPIPGGPEIERRYRVEPEQTREIRFELPMRIQKAAFMSGYKVPQASHPDSLALEVLGSLLSRGGSSPLGRLTQGGDAIAMYAGAWYQNSLDPGLFYISAMPYPQITLEELESRILAIIEDIRKNGVSLKEFERTKAQLIANDIYELQSSLGIARQLGEAEMVGSWRDVINREDRLRVLTPEDIQAAARKYLVATHRTTGYLLPENNGDGKENP